MKTLKIFILLCLLSGMGFAHAARVVYIKHRPPAARVVVVKPACPFKGGVWVSGNWSWKDGRYVWIDGRWEKPRHGFRWVDGHWQETRHGWNWVPGHWSRL